MIDRHRYITHCPGLPAIHNVNSGELTLVEVHIEYAAHLSSVLHAKGCQGIKLFCCDGLPAEKHSDEFARRHAIVFRNITAQLFPDRQQFLAGRGLEVPFLTTLRYMVGGISAGRFLLCALCSSFRMDCTADALILPLRKLIAQLVQHILQMLLQSFIIEMFLNGPFPSLVDPQNDFFLL